MKAKQQLLTAITWLAYFYLLCVAILTIAPLAQTTMTIDGFAIFHTVKEIVFIALLIYFAGILTMYKERRLIINSFYFYTACIALAIGGSFIVNQERFSAYLTISGTLVIISFINLAIQVFKIRHQQLKRPYKAFITALIVFISVKAISAMYFGFTGAFTITHYRAIMAYINLLELLVPLSIILLVNAIKNLPPPGEDHPENSRVVYL